MKGCLRFTSGTIVGVLLTVFFLSNYNEDPNHSQAEIQYIEVKGKKGNVTLYTGMPKDSVRLLLGKPDEIDLRSLGSTALEDWGYKIKNNYVSDLDVDFVDGKLDGVSQR